MECFTLKAKEAFLFNLKTIMMVKGISQSDLADAIGVSKQQVSKLFNSDSNLSLNTTEKIARALKVSETDMFNPDFASQVVAKKVDKLK